MLLLIFALIGFIFSELIPAGELCNVGFDFRNGTFNPSIDAKALSIFKFNFEKGKTYASPEAKEIVWQVPDEMEISTRLTSTYSSHESDFSEYHYYQKTEITRWNVAVGLELDSFGVEAGYSQENGKVQEWCKEKINNVFLSSILYTTYYAEPYPYLFMEKSDIFQKFIDFFPTEVKTERDAKIVKQFIQKYGTHFPENGFFGGRNKYDSSLKIEYMNQTTQKWCTSEFKLDFYQTTWNLTLGGGMFHNKSEISVDETYKKNADSEMFFEGGFLKYQTNETLGEWKESILQSQAMTNGTLTINYELFDDPQKQAVAKKAINDYIKTGKVSLKSYQDEEKKVRGYQYLQNGFNSLHGMSSAPIFDFGEFEGVPEGIKKVQTDDIHQVETIVHGSPNDYRKESSELFLDGATLVHSKDIYDFYKGYYKHNAKKVLSRKQYHLYDLEMDLTHDHQFSGVFKKAVKGLPRIYEGNEQEFYNFIRAFGTHYVSKVKMGGEMRMSRFVEKDADVDYLINENPFADHVDGIANYDKHVHTVGGNQVTDWLDFVDEIPTSSVPIHYTVQPIVDLLPTSVKGNVEKAIDDMQYQTEVKVKKVIAHLSQ